MKNSGTLMMGNLRSTGQCSTDLPAPPEAPHVIWELLQGTNSARAQQKTKQNKKTRSRFWNHWQSRGQWIQRLLENSTLSGKGGDLL